MRKFIAIILLLALVPFLQSIGQTDPPTGTGDWTIPSGDITLVQNQVVNLTGNLTVNGELKFENVTLNMNLSFEGEFGIFVNSGGKFYIYNSTITASNTSNRYHFKVYSGSFFEMKYSNLSYCGYNSVNNSDLGLFIATSNAIIEKNNIKNNYYGIFVDGSSPNIIWNKIENNEVDGIRAINNSVPIIENNTIGSNGEGIFSINSKPKIDNNAISRNAKTGIGLENSDATVMNNKIDSHPGYGIYIYNSKPIILHNDISINYYGIYSSDSKPEIKNNTILNNDECGIYLYNSDATIMNNTVNSNGFGGGWYASGIAMDTSSPIIKNNTIASNYIGGIVEFSNSNPQIEGNDISKNNVGIYADISDAKIINNNIYDNNLGIYLSTTTSTTVENNKITGSNDPTYGFGILCWGGSAKISNNTIKSNAQSGIWLVTSQPTIIGNDITANAYGIYLIDTMFKFENITVKGNSQYDFYLNDKIDTSTIGPAYLDLINVTFSKVGVGDASSVLNVYWFLDVEVVWESSGVHVPDAVVDIYELNNKTVAKTGKTSQDGWIRGMLAREYTYTGGAKKPTTPHNLNATYGKKLGSNVTNVNKNTYAKIILDDIAPYIKITSPSNNTITNKTTIIVNGDAELGAKVLVNDEEVTVSQGKFSTEVELVEGNNEIIAKAIDMSENYATRTINVVLDTIPPSLSLVEPKDNTYTNKTSIEVFGSAEQNAKIFVNGEEVENKEGKFNKSVVLMNEGDNVIIVKAKDIAGNFGEIKRKVIRDTYPPSLVITYPEEGFITNKLKV
ncbi:MAG: right-handed parallel beta-helix repeat-containing protein, partial [Candidatus Thermoplasmatota archaeon]